jgi:hypothetical protein
VPANADVPHSACPCRFVKRGPLWYKAGTDRAVATMLKTDTRQADWRRANPGKYEAHLAVQRAVKAGELDKETCEVCGVEGVDAHHDQYDEPLRVRWLCRLHHYGEDMFPIRSLKQFPV